LVTSATQVYGEDAFRALYGSIAPVPADRIRSVEDGETASLGNKTLQFLHVRGHANHHLVVHDAEASVVFTGDAFGLVYPAVQRAGRLAYPSTSPTDFDGPAAIASVRRIVALRPQSVALTHFGVFQDVGVIAEQLVNWLELATQLAQEGAQSGDAPGTLEQRMKRQLQQHLDEETTRLGLSVTDEERRLLNFDIELNAQGLAVAAMRLRNNSASALK
jgi:glyoxylase-like metal-dependent hydrolase (beta-lactamase superfamily II)